MDNLFLDGFDERTISMALDVFLRDFAQFEVEDMQNDTFKRFVQEIGINIVTFTHEDSYVKTARFMDWYGVDDATLWINLEQYVMKKDSLFSGKSLIHILSHFSAQHEGSRDFYDFIEFLYNSDVFKDCTDHDIITLQYSFYQVHSGTMGFAKNTSKDLMERISDKTSTYDLLRIMQAFSEISKEFPKLYI